MRKRIEIISQLRATGAFMSLHSFVAACYLTSVQSFFLVLEFELQSLVTFGSNAQRP